MSYNVSGPRQFAAPRVGAYGGYGAYGGGAPTSRPSAQQQQQSSAAPGALDPRVGASFSGSRGVGQPLYLGNVPTASPQSPLARQAPRPPPVYKPISRTGYKCGACSM
jgi:hypothetical protein